MSDDSKRKLVAHLMRRAGFGATSAELDHLAELDYDELVDSLIDPSDTSWIGEHLVRRFHHEQSGMMSAYGPGEYWLYRMVTTKAPLIEKMTLFWHAIFATGYPKVIHGKVLSNQIEMFRRNCMGTLDDLLVQLSKDPAMIIWLDNQENHNGSINENYGRELLELFSMGVGNYSEDDIKEAARAFTGWTIGNTDYMVLRSERDSDWPYGRIAWHFEFKEDDHDYGEKEFLGQRGNFDGDEIVEIICRQEATPRFIARHLYNFFVQDEVPVPSWNDTPPRNPEAIDTLVKAYFDNGHSVKEMVRVLLKSDFFKSEEIRYKRVKSPAELVAGVLRLSGHLDRPRRDILEHFLKMDYMGQMLQNPPSVEGWHEGDEWIETGALLERVNFAAEQLGNPNMPGVARMIEDVLSGDDVEIDDLPQSCLRQLGEVEVTEKVMGILRETTAADDDVNNLNAGSVIRLIAASPDFQKC
jgi:uncharacterized protein (DUF1800 family)|tara:strand:- start:1134 stop:2540 length:1407 start_codon:yes stop_codon:yes gene_type:complete